MKNPLFNIKSVIKGSNKAIVGAPEQEREPKLFERQSRSGNKKFRLHNTDFCFHFWLSLRTLPNPFSG
jgi:hypothetical protein